LPARKRIVKTSSQEKGATALAYDKVVGKILFICNPETTIPVRDSLRGRFPKRHVSTSPDILVEANTAGISKVAAVVDGCAAPGIEPVYTTAIGDTADDLSMLETTGTGIVMGNAVPQVRKKANFVCATSDEDEGCKKLFEDAPST
jgi:hydroxymethylpyrimidine pyrophosphatase-like HAD family hydrolase